MFELKVERKRRALACLDVIFLYHLAKTPKLMVAGSLHPTTCGSYVNDMESRCSLSRRRLLHEQVWLYGDILRLDIYNGKNKGSEAETLRGI